MRQQLMWPYLVGYYLESLSSSETSTLIICPSDRDDTVASVQQGRIILTTLLQTSILLRATRSYLITKFQDERANPMEEDTTLLHSTLLIYANVRTIAHTTLLHFLDMTWLHLMRQYCPFNYLGVKVNLTISCCLELNSGHIAFT